MGGGEWKGDRWRARLGRGVAVVMRDVCVACGAQKNTGAEVAAVERMTPWEDVGRGGGVAVAVVEVGRALVICFANEGTSKKVCMMDVEAANEMLLVGRQ